MIPQHDCAPAVRAAETRGLTLNTASLPHLVDRAQLEQPEHQDDRRRFLIWALMFGAVPPHRVVERILAEVEDRPRYDRRHVARQTRRREADRDRPLAARCPAHADKRPSLSIRELDDGACSFTTSPAAALRTCSPLSGLTFDACSRSGRPIIASSESARRSTPRPHSARSSPRSRSSRSMRRTCAPVVYPITVITSASCAPAVRSRRRKDTAMATNEGRSHSEMAHQIFSEIKRKDKHAPCRCRCTLSVRSAQRPLAAPRARRTRAFRRERDQRAELQAGRRLSRNRAARVFERAGRHRARCVTVRRARRRASLRTGCSFG